MPSSESRRRHKFSIESLVGSTDDEDHKSESPPPATTKLTELDTHLLHLKEQLIRDQLINRERAFLPQKPRIITRDEPPLPPISPRTPSRNEPVSPFDEEILKKEASPPCTGSPIPPAFPPQSIHQIFSGIPFNPHMINGLPPHLQGSPLVPSHAGPILGANHGVPLGTPLPPSPSPREYPLYPWLLASRHGRIFPPGFPGK